jgi:radical SAM protein with 4Fe4S-binding SPASM domain
MNRLTRARGMMDLALYQKIIDPLSPTLYYLNLSFQGEPYLHPQLSEMIAYAKSKHIYVSTSTNGHFLTSENARKTIESGLDRLIVSLDGTDAEAYEQYRAGGDFNSVITGIQEIVKQKKALNIKYPKVVLQFLILKSNQHQVKQIRQFGKELGVDKVELKSAQFYDFSRGNPLMPDDPAFSRYRKTEGTDGQFRYRLRNRLPNHCLRMWSSCVISWDGMLVPCCFDKDAEHSMGNLQEQAFPEVWKNEAYREFRKRISTSRKSIDICINCTEGMRKKTGRSSSLLIM